MRLEIACAQWATFFVMCAYVLCGDRERDKAIQSAEPSTKPKLPARM